MATWTATSSLSCRWYWSIRPTRAAALLPARRRARPSTASASSCRPSWCIWPESRTWVSVSSRRPKSRSAAWRARSRLPPQHGDPQRQLLAALHRGVVQRLDGVGRGQRVVAIALLLQQLGQLESQARFGPRGLGDPGELVDRLVLVAVPQQDVAGAEPRIGRVGRVGCRLRLPEEMRHQVADQVLAACRARTPCAAPGSPSRRRSRSAGGTRRGCTWATCRPRSGTAGCSRPVGRVQRPVRAGRGAGALVLEPAAEHRHLVVEDLQDVVERLPAGADAHALGQGRAGSAEVDRAGVIGRGFLGPPGAARNGRGAGRGRRRRHDGPPG